MGSSGHRVVIEDADGALRALCKIQILADGGYSVICPYHSAREGWLFKIPIGLGYGPQNGKWASVEDAVHYTASDHVKLSHHRDGLVQFSSESKGTIRSGINVLGLPRGIGVFSVPIDVGVTTGPAFGLSAWGLGDYSEVDALRKSDLVFRIADMDFQSCTPGTANGYSLEGWLLSKEWRGGIHEGTGDSRIRLCGTTPAGQSRSIELRVIQLRGTESFVGVQVRRIHQRFPDASGFWFGGPRGREGDQIVAAYPRPDGTFADAESLDYRP
ncbi:hypothetical protein [Tsukamurella paurometabola]|uniref:Uncharacterized protein n=1 Tax=Tsukamurella paurometabola TaxID=2061 RepID=A0A3P8KJ29_TSUPA|nr:hypothetical protein [Tsukamurella paurometabola]UEA83313.1 hypothetical protein LK411_00175 [Tsukamurella paurometabola]VDR40418.1 Uncharacterised protein [Tsukamurella paurometabola]